MSVEKMIWLYFGSAEPKLCETNITDGAGEYARPTFTFLKGVLIYGIQPYRPHQ